MMDGFLVPATKIAAIGEVPPLCSLSKVKTFPHATSHAKNATLVGTQGIQMPLTGNKGFALGFSTLQASLREKLQPTGPIHEILSKSEETLSFCKELRMVTAKSTSQSLKSLVRLSFQLPFPTYWSQTSATVSVLLTAKSKKVGKEYLRGSVPHHGSSQNLILEPLPMLNL